MVNTQLLPRVKSALDGFQLIIDSVVIGIPGVKTYLDDILVADDTMVEQDHSLYAVLKRVNEFVFHLHLGSR